MASILGIGNALTDILAVLPDDTFLKEFHLPKGSMQHVDMETGDKIWRTLKPMGVQLVAGGSAANTKKKPAPTYSPEPERKRARKHRQDHIAPTALLQHCKEFIPLHIPERKPEQQPRKSCGQNISDYLVYLFFHNQGAKLSKSLLTL